MTEPAKPHVLILDDDRLSRQLLVRITKRADFDPIAAATGDEALELYASTENVALVISDVLMPGMDGKQFRAKLVESHPDARVLFISGLPAAEFPELIDAPNTSFLQKPFKPKDLLEAIRESLEL